MLVFTDDWSIWCGHVCKLNDSPLLLDSKKWCMERIHASHARSLNHSWHVSCRIAGRHLVLSGGNPTHIKMSDDCAVYLCTLVSSQHQASLLWRGLGFLATFALQSCLMCSILRIPSLQFGCECCYCGWQVSCSIIVVCRSALITTYPCSISTIQKTHILEQAHAWTCHGVFDTCHQHVVLLALVRVLRSRLSYAGLLYIKLTTFPVTIECIHEATSCQSLKDNRKHNQTKVI